MKAADIMSTSVICVRPETEFSEIARQMIENHVSAVPVVDAGNRIAVTPRIAYYGA